MRVCIVSDTHRNRHDLMRAVSAAGGIDAVLHAGDETVDARWLADQVQCPVYGVAGNWDRASDEYPDERVIEQFGPVILLTHGHLLQVKGNLKTLAETARSKGAQIAVFGHTHTLQTAEVDGVLCVNPGSVAEPRGRRARTYALLSVESSEERHVVSVSHHTLDGAVVPETQLRKAFPSRSR